MNPIEDNEEKQDQNNQNEALNNTNFDDSFEEPISNDDDGSELAQNLDNRVRFKKFIYILFTLTLLCCHRMNMDKVCCILRALDLMDAMLWFN